MIRFGLSKPCRYAKRLLSLFAPIVEVKNMLRFKAKDQH